ncbi:MAG: protein-L-isoaspartate(D-aspartate) O-methyltransferase [Deltaproteobacteria bacterium]|nr:protein-L-isoaspartate(D-aspartate) O-methyltransferase [Deltaproteobacteria bacterium]
MKPIKLFFCVILFFLSGLIFPSAFSADSKENTDPFRKAREQMVKKQIQERGITGKALLEALRKVERHRFVPERYRDQAYNDYPLPIGEKQTISQPYIVALMTSAIEPDDTKKVLEIGTGSGYQAAVLAETCKTVYTIEIIPVLGRGAENLLNKLGYKNIKVKIGDGYQGWTEFAPFDAIIVTCAPSHIPQPLKDQLAEGGRIIIPVGGSVFQSLQVLEKKGGKIIEKQVIPVRFVPMMDKEGKKY